MTALDRLTANGNSIIAFLSDFGQATPSQISYTWINDDDSEEVITHDNIALMEQRITVDQSKLSGLIQASADAIEPSGYIRANPDSMGILEFSPNGSTVQNITFEPGTLVPNYTENELGDFIDGATAVAKTVQLTPIDAMNPLKLYINSKLYTLTQPLSVTLSNHVGIHYVYAETDTYAPEGVVLKSSIVLSENYFRGTPVTAVININNAGTPVLFGDERHGIAMDGETHLFLHVTQGCQYVSGMLPTGLVVSGTTFTGINEGKAYDEDLELYPKNQTELSNWWYKGATAGWRAETPDNKLSIITTTNATYNDFDAGTLVDLVAGEFSYTFLALTNDAKSPYIKIIGQDKYTSLTEAQDGASTASKYLNLEALPTPEFHFIGTVIINHLGEIQLTAGGDAFEDLRTSSITGTGSSGGSITTHNSTSNRDAASCHPMSAITDLEASLNGRVIQTIYKFDATTPSQDYETWGTTSSLSMNITPKSSTSKFLVTCSVNWSGVRDTYMMWRYTKDGAVNRVGAGDDGALCGSHNGFSDSSHERHEVRNQAITDIVTPTFGEQNNITLQHRRGLAGGQIHINRSVVNYNDTNHVYYVSSMIIQEIEGL